MERTPQVGTVMGAIHVLQNIMDGDHVGTGESARHPEKVRDVHQIAMQAFQDGATLEIALRGRSVVEQGYGLKIGRQWAYLCNLLRRADEEILVRVIQAAKRPHYISRVRPNAEFGHSADVDGDLHGTDLTTKDTKVHKGILV
jgi:hypothetical protein